MLVVCLRWLLCFGKMEKFEIYFRSPVRQRLGQKRADLRSASLCRCNPWSEQNGGAVSEWRIRKHCLSNWPPACRGITPASAKNTCATVANPGSTYAQRNNRRHAPPNLFMSPTRGHAESNGTWPATFLCLFVWLVVVVRRFDKGADRTRRLPHMPHPLPPRQGSSR